MIPESPLNQMLDAARHGQWKVVDNLIEAGTPVNEWHPDTQTPIIAMLAENLLAEKELPQERVNAYFRVNGLIERGGSLSWAIYGAALGRHPKLMEALLNDLVRYDNKGVALLPLHYIEDGLNWAVLGAARSGNRVLVADLLARGASVDWAVRGAVLGRHREYVLELLAQKASPEEAISAAAQVGDAALVSELFPKGEAIEMSRACVCGAALGGHSDLVSLNLNANGEWAREALRAAASGGHRALVTEILQTFPDPMLRAFNRNFYGSAGALEGGHVALLDEYLGQERDGRYALKLAIHAQQFDLLNRLATDNELFLSTLFRAAYELGFLKTEARATAFLAKIRDPFLRKQLLRHTQFYPNTSIDPNLAVSLLSLLQRANGPMKKYGLRYPAALAWEQHKEVLPILLSNAGHLAALPGDLKQRIAQHYVGVRNLSQADALSLYGATNKAYNGIKERCQAAAGRRTQEAAERACVRAVHDRRFITVVQEVRQSVNGRKKANALRVAESVEERTHALCIQRGILKPESFLPQSMRETMQEFPEFRTVLALRYWLKNCAQYMSTRFDRNQKLCAFQLKNLLPHFETFPVESADIRVIAEMLLMVKPPGYYPYNVENLLLDQPYWKDLLALFPGVEQALVENLKDDPVSRLA